MEHSITGESSWHLDAYKLKATDTDEARRNFPGYEKKQYYNLGDIQKGDPSGMTETDADTSGKSDGPYTEINKTKGKWGHAPKNKLSATTDMYNTDKPIVKNR